MNFKMILKMIFVSQWVVLAMAMLMSIEKDPFLKSVLSNFIGLNLVAGGIMIFIGSLYFLICWAMNESN